jgi:Rieske Fe-S protein
VIVGGEDVKQAHEDDAEDRFDRLVAWARPRFGVERAELRWSGMVMEPFDYLAFIGRDGSRDNVYLATGDSGHGITHGTIAGMLLTDLVVGRPNPWTTLYDPSRKTLSRHSVTEFVTETLDVAAQVARMAPVGGDVSGPDEIRPGEGAIYRNGARKVAGYRDESGALHELSAACTHLGCAVAWNSTERSWDCPCHGSRFAPTGEVLTGPAISPLPGVARS